MYSALISALTAIHLQPKYILTVYWDGCLCVCYSVPVRVWSIVINPSVCLCVVCPRAYLWNHFTDLHEILYADSLWPWLGPPLAALRYVMYFRFYG